MPAWLFWLIAAAVFGIAEVVSLDLVLIMVAGAALLAAAAAGLGAPLALQVGVFAVSAVGLLFVARPVAKRHMELSVGDHKLGIDALVGQEARVLQTVDAHGGRIRLAGEEWSARAYDTTQVLEIGRTVRVMEIHGATAVVWGEP